MPGSNSRPNVSEGYEVPLSYRGDRLEYFIVHLRGIQDNRGTASDSGVAEPRYFPYGAVLRVVHRAVVLLRNSLSWPVKGEYDKAGLKFKEALEIDTKVFGEWHREVMIDLQQLAGFLAKQVSIC